MYSNPYPNLLKPLKIKKLTLKNRIMSAPNMLFHTVDGRPTDYYISYLEHKARGGAGIVTLGEIAVCDGGNHTPGMDCSNDNLPLFAEMAAAIKEHGAAASVELTHGGMNYNPAYNKGPALGPVNSVNRYGVKVRAMTERDMEDVAKAFADMAEFWLHAGFDAILLHMAHGWLFPQFLSPLINTRTDKYGGSLENRMRFPLMVMKKIRERVGPSEVIQVRISGSERDPKGFTAEDIAVFLERAQEYVDMAEVSVEGITNFFACTYSPLGQNVDLSETIKKSGRVDIPIYTIGSILEPEQAEEIIASGKADGVSMSRALIADPFLPEKARNGRADEIVPCLRCLNCTDSDNANRHFVCSVNPLIGREARRGFGDDIGRAKYKKKVLVVGGGPAGMQAAITAAERGHEVILCERSDSLGGILRFVDYDSLKHDLRRYKDYLIRRVKAMDIKVLPGTEADEKLVARLEPDGIIVATGSVPVIPNDISGHETAHHASEVYFHPEIIRGDRVVIIGGGLVGIETGLHMSNLGKKVTVLEMSDRPASDAGMVYSIGVLAKAEELGVKIITGAQGKKIINNTVVYIKDGSELIAEGDTILYAVGNRSDDRVYYELYDKAPYVAMVGDCKRPGKVSDAIHSGYFAALDIGML
ncbi:MAG: FAD-dependent oxidoreductase [Clostridiales bacterium]|jgi:2,4-dienoyl-CoA reductase-like NADH-dependent reductase (Old Yellow Enzyme family)/thioredoxin reductase|nr:FAD-dependent oxidoreductase [Clostridiales bacterium]